MSKCARFILPCAVFVLATVAVLAEDSGVFKNHNDISRAQAMLVEDGYLAPNGYSLGYLDAATKQALTEYQSRHSLNDNGNLDDDTFQMLLSHEVSYPWGSQEAQTAAAEPIQPAARTVAAKTAEAAPVPAAVPSQAQVKEAPTSEPAAVPPARKMPATASGLPVLALAGLLTLGVGILVRRLRTA